MMIKGLETGKGEPKQTEQRFSGTLRADFKL